jgi:hypothetical protein
MAEDLFICGATGGVVATLKAVRDASFCAPNKSKET